MLRLIQEGINSLMKGKKKALSGNLNLEGKGPGPLYCYSEEKVYLSAVDPFRVPPAGPHK